MLEPIALGNGDIGVGGCLDNEVVAAGGEIQETKQRREDDGADDGSWGEPSERERPGQGVAEDGLVLGAIGNHCRFPGTSQQRMKLEVERWDGDCIRGSREYVVVLQSRGLGLSDGQCRSATILELAQVRGWAASGQWECRISPADDFTSLLFSPKGDNGFR